MASAATYAREKMSNKTINTRNILKVGQNFIELHKQLTWGKTSGRDSKMTSKTPMGTVTWVNSRPLASKVRRITRPTMSALLSAICFSPSLRLFSLAGVSVRRPRRGTTPPLFTVDISFKIFKSSKLALRICGCRSNSNSAKFWMISERWLPVRFCNWRPPSRAVQGNFFKTLLIKKTLSNQSIY